MPDRPNIVLVMTDSQGWNALGECGEGFADTPNLDALADEGVCFDRNYTNAVPCTPARSALFSGRYPHAAGAWSNNLRLYKGVETMGHYLREAGYRTGYVGKWHLDGDYFGTGDPAPGYDPEYWYDGQNYRDEIDEDLWEFYRAGMDTRVSENPIDEIHERDITRRDTWGGRITDRALEFIDDASDDDRPFFLVVSYDEPHEPSLCPPPFCDAYRDERYPLPDNYEEDPDQKPERIRETANEYVDGEAWMNSLGDAAEEGGICRPLYFGCVSFVDDEIGRVADAVDERAPDSVFAFTSDHGHYLGAHGLDLKHMGMYDEVTRMPLIVRGPSLPEGERSEALTSHVDLLPTFLEFAGADPPDELHGESFVETARDPDVDHREHALVEYHSYGVGDLYPVRAVVSDDGYKLVVNLFDSDELYDLDDEPLEVDNLIDDGDHAAVRRDLHDAMLATMDDTGDAFDCREWAQRPWRGDD